MDEVHINKPAAAQRELDAAIRIFFSGEDILAVHTLAHAAYSVLHDLDRKRGAKSDQVYAETLEDMRRKFSGAFASYDVRSFRKLMEDRDRSGANFLKHADKDSADSLNLSRLKTDDLMFRACHIYFGLGFSGTPEMKAFERWYFAVYPKEAGDRILTKFGDVSEFSLEHQLEFGAYLLKIDTQIDEETIDK